MKGSECRLIEYMDGSQKRFIIPVYQRNYDWKMENCKQLYDDLVKVIKNNRMSHFFGSLVSVYEPSGRKTEFLVIDGQQRLTTVSLLLLAMYNLIEEKKVVPQDEYLSRQIYESFLVDKFQPQETRIKLKPVKNDNAAFSKLFDSEDEYIVDSNLTVNYKYFYDRIQSQEISIDELYDAICRLEIINITLNNDDNPQLIFESLNSTGLDLSEGDKIRNFVLMGLPRKEQDQYYEEYWNRIEECTNYFVSAFIRDYLSVKQQAIPSQQRVYISFKDYVESITLSTQELLEDMLKYAKRYECLIKCSTVNKELNACIYRLNRLETTVTRPYFLEVLRLYDDKTLTIEQVKEIFLYAEIYLFRRSICDLPTNALNKIFLMLHHEIVRFDGSEENYVEKFKYALLSKKERARFPSDAEFELAFSEKQIYKMNMKNKIYILERFENYGTAEDKDVYRHCDEGIYSIEHIMPQTLTPAWIKELGEDYEEIHQTWLHRMANLTLTAYNSKYQNYPFVEKKTMKNGYADSGIRMNMYIAMRDKWTLDELKERDEYLRSRALTIWASPITEYKPAEKQMDSYSLDDESSLLHGRHIAKYSYKGVEQPVTSWVEMMLEVLKTLYTEDKSVLLKLAVSQDDGVATHFNLSQGAFIKCEEIGDGIFVGTNNNTTLKLWILKKVFALYDIDASDLVFYLRDEDEKNEDEIGTRYEIRRKYWAYALDILKETHKESGMYSNWNTTKETWVAGFFGVSGFSIQCIANFECARVEMYFGKSIKEENKKAYDTLVAHKSEIESKLGVSLNWERNDEYKSSKISYQINGVSIENESDWIQMASFHAEWSKKFNDVMLPYLT